MRFSRKTMIVLLALWLSCAACGTNKSPRMIVTDDRIGCDASVRKDCVTVTLEFVLQRGDLEGRLAKSLHALKACQEKL